MKKSFTLIFFLVAILCCPSAMAQVNLNQGLVAYYPLNGSAADFSGNNNNGTPLDNVTYIADAQGNPASAVSFGGTANQGRISIPHSASLNFTTGATFSFWARISNSTGTFGNGSVGAGGNHCFFAKAGDAGGGFWQLSNIQGADLRHQIGNNGMTALSGVFPNYSLNQWIHYTVTMDASGHRTYINGVLQTSNTTAANFSAMANRPLVLGRFNTVWYPLNGGLDEFRVYNRVLTTDEISALASNDLEEITVSYTIGSNLCAGDSLQITAQTTGAFAAGNQFLVQLSDPAGSFAQPAVIQRIAASSLNQTLTVTLPRGVPSGTQYRIRIVSTAPQQVSSSSAEFSITGSAGNIPNPTSFRYIGSINGKDYFQSRSAANIMTARSTCLANGGYLAPVSDAIVNQLFQSNAGSAPVFIGVNDAQTESIFVTESGARLTYTNWNPGEPNNSNNEDFVELVNGTGLWNDVNGSTARFYFMELNPAGGVQQVCEGANLQLQAPALTNATYSWTGPGGFSSSLQNPAISNLSLAQAGVYRLQYTVNGCTSSQFETVVEIVPLPRTIGQTQTLPASLTQGLTLHLPLNGNGTDVSPSGINATFSGAVTAAANRFEQPDSCIQLAGNGGHLQLPSGVYFNGGDFTVNAWVRKSSNNSWSRLFDFGNGQANQNVLLALTSGTTGRPASQTFTGTTGGPVLTSNQVLPDNVWQMITYSWSNGGGQLMINGVLVAQGPQNQPENVVRTLNYIGRSNWNSDGFLNARIDEFRIYNRLLTAEEIRQLVSQQINPLQAQLQNAQTCSGQSNSILLQNTQPGMQYQLRVDGSNTNVGAAQTGTGGTLTFTLPNLTATGSYHFLVQNPTLACSQIITPVITVPVTPLPAAPQTTGNSVCNEGSVTLTASGAPVGGIYNWYLTATGGTPIAGQTASTFQTPVLNATRTYFVSISVGTCESPRTAVTATVNNALAPAVDINSNLILYSKFNNDALDSTENAINGSVSGGPFSYEEDRNGVANSALSITNGAFVDYGNPGVVQQLTNQVTISMWIKQDASNFGFFSPLLNKFQGNGLYLALDSYQTIPPGPMNENRVRWRVNNSVFLNSSVNVIHGEWHHIVATYNGSQLRIYQNGVLSGQLNHVGTITNNSTNLQFGRQSNGLGNATFKGDVDEIRLYNRALSPDEVRTLFNNSSAAFATSPVCSNQGEIVLSTVAIPGATYQWTGPNNFSSTQQNPAAITQPTAANAGTYTLTITNPNGCVSLPQQVNVVVNQTPAAPEVSNAAVCGSGNATLSVTNPVAGAAYNWYTDPQGGTPIAGTTGSTLQINNVTANTVRYVSAVVAGCEGPRTAANVSYFSNVNTSLTVTGSTVCASATTAQVTISNAEAGVTYQAFLNDVPVSTTVTGTGANLLLSVNATLLSTGTNQVVVKANYPDCNPVNLSQQAQIIRVVPDTATITPSGTTQLCAGETVTLQASAGTSYLWSTGATSQSITVSQAGSYFVTITNAQGCTAESAAVTVTVTAIPSASITLSGSPNLCAGETVTLQATGGTSYLWNTGATTAQLTVSQPGDYFVTAFNGSCSAVSSAVTITQQPEVVAQITVQGSSELCPGETVTLTASSGSSYLWSTGATTPSITVSAAGSYTVTVFNGDCSAVSAPVAVSVRAVPEIPGTISGDTEICVDSAQLYSIAAVPGAVSYVWELPQGWTGTSTGTSILATSGTASGFVRVSAVNDCGESTQQTLEVTVVAIDATVLLNDAQLTAQAGADSYQWIDCTTNLPIAGADTAVYTATQNGFYAVEITENDCTTVSECVEVNTLQTVVPNAAFAIQAFPNPVDNRVDVRLVPAPNEKVQLTLYNVLGQQLSIVPTEVEAGRFSIDLPLLPQGQYLLHISNDTLKETVMLLKN